MEEFLPQLLKTIEKNFGSTGLVMTNVLLILLYGTVFLGALWLGIDFGRKILGWVAGWAIPLGRAVGIPNLGGRFATIPFRSRAGALVRPLRGPDVVVAVALGVYLWWLGRSYPALNFPISYPMVAGLLAAMFLLIAARQLRANVVGSFLYGASHPGLRIHDFIGDDEVGVPRGYLRVENDGANTQAWAVGEIINGEMPTDRWEQPWHIPWRWPSGGEPIGLHQGGVQILGLNARVTHRDLTDPDGFAWILEFQILSGGQLENIRVPWRPTEPQELCIVRIRITTDPSERPPRRPNYYDLGLDADENLIWRLSESQMGQSRN